ncbi:MAG: hypothetical protein IKJ45_07655, partial [Kiritimatiellae bacterium]|nr:hypothetical protein [Kiritimatiellia bacterium]
KKGCKGAMFSQGMTLPMELSLVRTPAGLRLARAPVRELKSLRDGEATTLGDFSGELAEIEFSCRPVADSYVTLDIRGVKLIYSACRKTMTTSGLSTGWRLDADGRLGLRIFVDRVGMEIFSLDGLQYLPLTDACPRPENRKITWSAGGPAKPVSDVRERVWRLKSAVCR